MKKYNEFLGISFDNNGIFNANQADVVYKCLMKNGITDFQQLFCSDDAKTIDYGTNEYDVLEIKGVIKLLRYKYLREDLAIESLVIKKLNYLDYESQQLLLRSLGFSKKEVRTLLNNASIVLNYIDNFTNIIDLIKGNYNLLVKEPYSKTPNLASKLNIIINYIDEKIKSGNNPYAEMMKEIESLRAEVARLKRKLKLALTDRSNLEENNKIK